MSKKLIAYFSASGTTASKAKALAKAAEADIVEIKPVKPYSEADLNWRNPLSRCNREKIKKTKPEIVKPDIDMSQYDVIFVGYPIWYYREPLIVDSFLEAYDFTGKTVVLFATSGGSDFGKTLDKISADYPDIKFIEGKVLNGSASNESLKAFADSIDSILQF